MEHIGTETLSLLGTPGSPHEPSPAAAREGLMELPGRPMVAVSVLLWLLIGSAAVWHWI